MTPGRGANCGRGSGSTGLRRRGRSGAREEVDHEPRRVALAWQVGRPERAELRPEIDDDRRRAIAWRIADTRSRPDGATGSAVERVGLEADETARPSCET